MEDIKKLEIIFKPIGVLHSPFKSVEETPRWYTISDLEGMIEIFEEFEEGLDGIEKYDEIDVLYFFHQARTDILKVKPPNSSQIRGVFAARSPHRPNPIALSTVKLIKKEGRFLRIKGLDAVDGTPVLDLKPHKE
ncbi:MAG: tRNA (N6-threonylcarbamoyladenosine(37)-N6)-methyltransferase TrmO [Actinobacteria bacterium]|nr:tRNA (N6-threonylcarbamoyladenosine(37)-N6)-methyltransferase TrmO [Actinomycetota bacterium]